MKHFVTRNRRDEPATTLLDAWEDNTYLGVCAGYSIVNGEVVINWNEDMSDTKSVTFTEAQIAISKAFFANSPDECLMGIRVMAEKLTELAKKPAELQNITTEYTVEFDWQMGHEVIEGFTSVGAAKGYKDEVLKKFSWANIENFKVLEVKSVKKEV